jgi:hypothetical protein
MTNVTTPANNVSPSLVAARENYADTTVRGYGATKVYAQEMTTNFGVGWYESDADPLDVDKAGVAAEKKALYAMLKAGGHTNPSVAWARVVKEAKALDADPEEGGANHTRSLTLRLIEELTKLHKAGMKSDTKGDKEVRALAYVAGALVEMGVDLAKA